MGAAAPERADTQAMTFLSSGELYRRARKVEQIAKIVMDCTAADAAQRDVHRATRLMHEIGEIAGSKDRTE